jgi:hypothetical protein
MYDIELINNKKWHSVSLILLNIKWLGIIGLILIIIN